MGPLKDYIPILAKANDGGGGGGGLIGSLSCPWFCLQFGKLQIVIQDFLHIRWCLDTE